MAVWIAASWRKTTGRPPVACAFVGRGAVFVLSDADMNSPRTGGQTFGIRRPIAYWSTLPTRGGYEHEDVDNRLLDALCGDGSRAGSRAHKETGWHCAEEFD